MGRCPTAEQLITVVLIAVSASGLVSTVAYGDPVDYVLWQPSDFQEGCQPPCLCPVMIGNLTGSFLMTPMGLDGRYQVFAITDVEWNVLFDFPGGEVPVAGAGIFRISQSPEPMQRLEMDLTLGDEPPVHFDSGFAPVRVEFPVLDIAVAENAFYCYDRVFTIQAAPEGYIPVDASSWGAIKATFQ